MSFDEDRSKVISIQSSTQHRPAKQRPNQPRGRQRSNEPATQENLNLFAGNAAPARVLKSSLDSQIYCSAKVASVMHRLLAVFIDIMLSLIGVGLFATTFYVAGGTFPLTDGMKLVYVGFAGLVYLLYELLWTVASGETIGMRWAHLRLLDFDGRTPDLQHRLLRLGSYLLSLSAVGIGVIWACTDEEALTWHDHISNTFPTSDDRKKR